VTVEQQVVRPSEGDPITVLGEAHGVPFTHAAVAGRLRGATLFIGRRPGDARWAVEPQGTVVVLFTRDGRLYSWSMRIEEVLPSSYYLVSLQEPSIGERRQFVRAAVPLRVRLRRVGEPEAPWRSVEVDLSASGFRLPWDGPGLAGDLLDVTLRSEEAQLDITAVARVVRTFDTPAGRELACEFEELDSSDEERLLEIVYRARESALHERIGKRNFA